MQFPAAPSQETEKTGYLAKPVSLLTLDWMSVHLLSEQEVDEGQGRILAMVTSIFPTPL